MGNLTFPSEPGFGGFQGGREYGRGMQQIQGRAVLLGDFRPEAPEFRQKPARLRLPKALRENLPDFIKERLDAKWLGDKGNAGL
jgi:hypothetical protein